MVDDNVTETENPAEVTEEKVEDAKTEVTDKEESKEEKPKKSWYEKRIERFTRQNQDLARTNEQLLQELTNLKSGKTEEGAKSTLSQAEIDKLVEAKAAEIIEQREFNLKCNSVYEDGAEEFDDFPDKVKTLGNMGILTRDFLDLVTDLEASHKVLYHLGENPEEADRIQSLTPAKQALALAKLESSIKDTKSEKKADKKEVISKAPPPIKPVESNKSKGSSGWGTKYYEGMPQDEFEFWDDNRNKRA